MHRFTVSHGGRPVEFSVPEQTTIGELREQIAQEFGVEPTKQKLLLRGSLADNSQPVSTAIPSGSKVILVGTATRELQQFNDTMARRSEGLRNNAKYMATSSSVTRTSHRVGTLDSLDQCTFHAFEVLPSLPQKDKAMAVLRKLAKDEGVRQIMQKHKYSVGILRELHPFEQTILGYNRNRGQVIALRLRTDDLEGFRDYLSVRQVLMHELAHMVWDEHDERFHELNRTHCKEVVELDWTRRGNTLAGNRRQVEVYDPEVEMQVDGGSLKPQGFVLGGKKAPEMPSMPSSAESDPAGARRDLLYRAYEKRNNKEL